MTDMTPAPISVERLREVIAFLLGEGELDNRWFGDGSAPLVAGKYRAPYWWRTQLRETTDSLLHQLAELEQKYRESCDITREWIAANNALSARAGAAESKLAERDAEVERLRDAMRDADAAFLAMLERAEAAERAKEEFRLLASLRLFHAPTIGYCWFERCGVSWTGKAHATINEANAEKTAAFLAASGGDRP